MTTMSMSAEKSAEKSTVTNGEVASHPFLAAVGAGRKRVSLFQGEAIYVQGDVADCVIYILKGQVKLSVVSPSGKEASLGILAEHNFFGEGALAGIPQRTKTALALTNCEILRIDKKVMEEALHTDHSFAEMFLRGLLARNVRYEEDLVDHLFNSCEKRLARIILLLANFGKEKEGEPKTSVPKLSQETLAEMVGTTRSRVSYFMNRFRESGFIDYSARAGAIQVNPSLQNVVGRD